MNALEHELVLEGTPTDDQKGRLEDFFTELMLLTRRYRIVLLDRTESVELHDLPSGHVIGIGITPWTAPEDPSRLIRYDPTDSILDGMWPVDTADGPAEQYLVMNVFPRRDGPE